MNSDSWCPIWIINTASFSFYEDQNSWKVQTVDQSCSLKVRPDGMVKKRAASPGDNLLILFDLISLHQLRLKAKKYERMIWGQKKPLGHSCPKKCYILTKYLTKTQWRNRLFKKWIMLVTAEKNIPPISIDFGKGWTYRFLSCFSRRLSKTVPLATYTFFMVPGRTC